MRTNLTTKANPLPPRPCIFCRIVNVTVNSALSEGTLLHTSCSALRSGVPIAGFASCNSTFITSECTKYAHHRARASVTFAIPRASHFARKSYNRNRTFDSRATATTALARFPPTKLNAGEPTLTFRTNSQGTVKPLHFA